MKKEAKKILKLFKKIINSQQFLEEHRISKNCFIRKRKLPFPILILFMLNLVKKSLQKELTEFFSSFSNEKNITNSAFCQSRMNLNYTAFIELNDLMIESFYQNSEYKTWEDFRLLAIDGSRLQLPISKEIVEFFGYAKNNHATITSMAQASCCFDLLNKKLLNSEINHYETSEYDLALEHLDKINPLNDLLIYDRGYSGIWFMFYNLLKQKDFVVRMQKNSIPEVRNFFISNEKSKTIEIKKLSIKSDEHLKRLKIDFSPFKIRLIKVVLENGEIEVLATSLINEKKYPNKVFKDLYFLRWGIETEFDHLKNHLMIEDFTGLSSLSVLQDFYSTQLATNLQRVIIKEAEEELQKEKKNTKYNYKVNKNLATGFMKDRLIEIIFTKNNKEQERKYDKLKDLFKINPTPIRKGRSFPRVYHKTRKKFYIKKKRAI
ncbi:MAG TPA: IS4 family transposase [Candidatus Pacearchaeota archaeon]|nr:transposase DDE domain protein [archaeon BMS3Abin17]HDK41769.1 IS4 family transposase [Candidatus Pacearchaeota archaeon]HDZ61501.1 IS4 family transposase [Candidatus Pacearchaeota archaeon]